MKTQQEIEQMARAYSDARKEYKDLDNVDIYSAFMACYTALLPDLTAMQRKNEELTKLLKELYIKSIPLPDFVESEYEEMYWLEFTKEHNL